MVQILFAAAIIIPGTASQAQSTGTREDEAAIRGIIVQMTAAFNQHDASAATAMYASDADFVTARGDRSKSVESVRNDLAKIFATRARNARHNTLDVSVRFIRPDVAIAHVTNELSGLVAQDGQNLPSQRELSLRVNRKAADSVLAFLDQAALGQPSSNQ